MEKNDIKIEYDELTGVYNRNTFYRLAKEMIRKDPDAKYMLILSDVESFKMINVRYGEEKGDELLAFVGKYLSYSPGADIIFARYSGDQFVGFSKQVGDPEDEESFNQNLMFAMEQMYENAPVNHFEVKFGIYEDVDLSLPISRMCDRALMALRTIKHQYGKSVAWYDQRMHQQYMKEQHIQECMEGALKDNQFQVYYQPKHDAKTGKLVGAEALIRWTHPVYGFMSPADFIPLFEKNGFISSVDLFVLKRVCEDLKAWKTSGISVVPVSVNASRKDILQSQFLEKIKSVLEGENISSDLLHMEITETVFIEDVEYLKPIIQEARDFGIHIELDDFGSGFSALSLLTSLPLDVIKLDMSFVRSIEKQKMIIENIINICHGLNCKMVAEGVETEEQLAILREMNCDTIQGYYFSKPLPAEGFREYIENCNRL
ncbi:MAG: GGDEF domain-containing phosphodiesterase [Eubacteriales bacterium]|nr:GGDEF domain-containing phosphodiesterase [Eubacteriales bacterium]